MSSSGIGERNKTLLIVEGNHEKNKFFSTLFWCFHEFNIRMENVWIYGTNIYQLYDDIVKEYGVDWFENHDDIDLPFVVSKKKKMREVEYKTNYTNIIIVFDYERHDPAFSEKKIKELQETFDDPADMGKLYINYPMMEAAYHLTMVPDEEYIYRSYSVAKSGSDYKGLVRKESCVRWDFELPGKLADILAENYLENNDLLRNECCNKLLDLPDESINAEMIKSVLPEYMEGANDTLAYQLTDWLKKSNHFGKGLGYRSYMRRLFQKIARYNIDKAYYIQTGKIEVGNEKCVERFNLLDSLKTLQKQNEFSREKGLVWVLSTAVFFIPDYNTKLLTE